MIKFVLKALLFVVPFFVSFLLAIFLVPENKGDLMRIANLVDNTSNYRDAFSNEFNQKVNYTEISKLDEKGGDYTVLTIGDSFSQQENSGYQNFLASDYNITLLNYDVINYEVTSNPINTCYGIINGDILEKINVEYIIIQCVERKIVDSGNRLNHENILTRVDIIRVKLNMEKNHKSKFFSERTIGFPLYNILYRLNQDNFSSKVYRTKLDGDLFSINHDELLFYYRDLESVLYNNNFERVRKLNEELNNLSAILSKKNIKLIFLPSPDKYGLYYDFIIDKDKYPKPLFFVLFENLSKQYIYIDTYKMLSKIIQQGEKDVYLYDDSHWSPKATKLIANRINEIIKKESINENSNS